MQMQMQKQSKHQQILQTLQILRIPQILQRQIQTQTQTQTKLKLENRS